MPTSTYADNYNDTPSIDRLRQARSAYTDGKGKATERFGQAPKHLALSDKEKMNSGKEMQNKLSRLQRSAPKTAAGLATGKKSAVASFVLNLFMQVDLTTDWLFLILFSFGFLKDIFDLIFAAAGVGTLGLGLAIGIIVSFVWELFFLILVVTVLVLAGGSLKNRGMTKYLIGVMMEFIAEALPGISWLPWTVIYVFILYLCVLYDRAYSKQAEQSENADQPEKENILSSGTADSYEDRLAA